MTNRIIMASALYAKSLANVTPEKQAELNKTLATDILESAAYFELNAVAHATGILNLEESQLVYNALKSWETQDLATKLAITKLMAELAQRRLQK